MTPAEDGVGPFLSFSLFLASYAVRLGPASAVQSDAWT